MIDISNYKEMDCPVIDLNDISAKKLESYGKWKFYHSVNARGLILDRYTIL